MWTHGSNCVNKPHCTIVIRLIISAIMIPHYIESRAISREARNREEKEK